MYRGVVSCKCDALVTVYIESKIIPPKLVSLGIMAFGSRYPQYIYIYIWSTHTSLQPRWIPSVHHEMRVFFLKVAIILRWMQRNGDCQTEPRLTEPYYEYINTIYSYTWNIYSMYISSVIAYHIYIPSNHPAVISHQHTILDPHGSCIPSDCPSTWWLQCAVVMERVFSSDNMQAGKPRIIWTKRLEPLGVLGAVQKGQLEYLETIWIWYNWTIYPTIGYNWFLWQQLLIECATKKKKQHLFQFRMPTTIFPPKMTSCSCTAAPLTTSQW